MKKRRISVILCLAMLLCMLPATASAAAFSDVDPSSYYYDGMLWAVESDITSGTGGGKFSPNKPCSRAEIVTFLWRAFGEPEPTAANCAFRDIEVNSFYFDAMMWACESNITTGTSYTTFSPNRACSRAEIVTFMYRLVN